MFGCPGHSAASPPPHLASASVSHTLPFADEPLGHTLNCSETPIGGIGSHATGGDGGCVAGSLTAPLGEVPPSPRHRQWCASAAHTASAKSPAG